MAETTLTIWRPARNRIYCMDAFLFLRSLPPNSVNCIVTSPPYFGLRQYFFDKAVVLRHNLTMEERDYVERELERLKIEPRQKG